jgi:hypothetical protein
MKTDKIGTRRGLNIAGDSFCTKYVITETIDANSGRCCNQDSSNRQLQGNGHGARAVTTQVQ